METLQKGAKAKTKDNRGHNLCEFPSQNRHYKLSIFQESM